MKETGVAAALCIGLLLMLCFAVPDGQILWEAGDALYTDGELLPMTWSTKSYGVGLSASALAAWAISCGLSRRRPSVKGALRWLVWALALGILFARLIYCVGEPSYYNKKWISHMAALRIWDGGMAITGALAGILLAGRLSREGEPLASIAAPLFLIGARLSEMFSQLGYGPSVDFEGVLTRQIGYTVRLNVSLLEAALALIILILILLLPGWAVRRGRRLTDGRCVCAFLIFYGVSQILMESLRRDRHMVWGFTKAQQILAILLVLGTLLSLADTAKRRCIALAGTACAAAVLVGLEFALDRADVSAWLLYSIYLLVIGAYLWFAWRFFSRSLPRVQ